VIWIGMPLLVGRVFGVVASIDPVRRVVLVLIDSGREYAEISVHQALHGVNNLLEVSEEIWNC
jgi:hypothetical protein